MIKTKNQEKNSVEIENAQGGGKMISIGQNVDFRKVLSSLGYGAPVPPSVLADMNGAAKQDKNPFNGIQAIAFIPIKKDGTPDFSRITFQPDQSKVPTKMLVDIERRKALKTAAITGDYTAYETLSKQLGVTRGAAFGGAVPMSNAYFSRTEKKKPNGKSYITKTQKIDDEHDLNFLEAAVKTGVSLGIDTKFTNVKDMVVVPLSADLKPNPNGEGYYLYNFSVSELHPDGFTKADFGRSVAASMEAEISKQWLVKDKLSKGIDVDFSSLQADYNNLKLEDYKGIADELVKSGKLSDVNYTAYIDAGEIYDSYEDYAYSMTVDEDLLKDLSFVDKDRTAEINKEVEKRKQEESDKTDKKEKKSFTIRDFSDIINHTSFVDEKYLSDEKVDITDFNSDQDMF